MPEKRTIPRTCEQCGTPFLAWPSAVKKGMGRYCSMSCRNESYKGRKHEYCERPTMVGEGNPNWNGGVANHSAGYRSIRQSDGTYALEHRIVMETHLGRPLLPDEDVHHISLGKAGKSDNRIENLQVMSKAEHARLHATLRKSSD